MCYNVEETYGLILRTASFRFVGLIFQKTSWLLLQCAPVFGAICATIWRCECAARRPKYVSLLSQSEKEFRSYVDSLETHPAFDRLMSDGVIAKVRLRGKIPREKYEAFMDEQMMDFLKFFGITNHDEWERDFLSPHAMERAPRNRRKIWRARRRYAAFFALI